MTVNAYKGYSLFEDVESFTLRAHNRGVTIANIFEEHQLDGKVSARGLSLIVEYFKAVPDLERAAAREAFNKVAAERGFSNAK